jgi:hypothetical protein
LSSRLVTNYQLPSSGRFYHQEIFKIERTAASTEFEDGMVLGMMFIMSCHLLSLPYLSLSIPSSAQPFPALSCLPRHVSTSSLLEAETREILRFIDSLLPYFAPFFLPFLSPPVFESYSKQCISYDYHYTTQ